VVEAELDARGCEDVRAGCAAVAVALSSELGGRESLRADDIAAA